jgi:hypothetical protein
MREEREGSADRRPLISQSSLDLQVYRSLGRVSPPQRELEIEIRSSNSICHTHCNWWTVQWTSIDTEHVIRVRGLGERDAQDIMKGGGHLARNEGRL